VFITYTKKLQLFLFSLVGVLLFTYLQNAMLPVFPSGKNHMLVFCGFDFNDDWPWDLRVYSLYLIYRCYVYAVEIILENNSASGQSILCLFLV